MTTQSITRPSRERARRAGVTIEAQAGGFAKCEFAVCNSPHPRVAPARSPCRSRKTGLHAGRTDHRITISRRQRKVDLTADAQLGKAGSDQATLMEIDLQP
jgi:hypothetical protein